MDRRRRAACLALVATLLVALLVWWFGVGGDERGFERADDDTRSSAASTRSAVELAIDDREPSAAVVREGRDGHAAADADEPAEGASVAPPTADLVLRVDVPRAIRARFVDRTVEAPAWLAIPASVPSEPPLRVLGRRTGEGWQFRVRLDAHLDTHLDAPAPTALELELPGGVRLDEQIDLAPGPNRRVIDLGERDGAPVRVSLRLDEATLELVEEQVDLEAAGSEVLDASDPRGWIALVDAASGAFVTRAPIVSTKRADAPDDDLEFADALFGFVPSGDYRAELEGGPGAILVRRADDAGFTVEASDGVGVVEHALVLELAQDLERALTPVRFDVSASGGAPASIELFAYGTWGAHGVDEAALVERVELTVESGLAQLPPTALAGWTPLRFMIVADGSAPVFLDATEAIASAVRGDPPLAVDLVPGSGGVLFAGGDWGRGARGPADGLVVEVDGATHTVERGFVELAFGHGFGVDASAVRVPAVLGGDGGGADDATVPVRVENGSRCVLVEVDGR